MFKKLILVSICLILLASCGRKNDLFETSLNNKFLSFTYQNNIFEIPRKNEIYQ